MPPSPSFPSASENPTKWRRKKRRRESHKRHADDHRSDDDNQPDEDHSDDQIRTPNPSNQRVEVEEVSLDGVQISQFPPVIKRTVTRPHSSVAAIAALESGDCWGRSQHNVPVLENLSHGQLQAVSTVSADCLGGDGAGSVVASPPVLKGSGIAKPFGSRVLVVPMHSDWFSPDSVHRLERQAVPHFFSGKSPDHTPEKYMECRNYIVARYLVDPGEKIRVSSCQGLSVGVSNEDLARIVWFLDHWGIINYCAQGSSHEYPDKEICLKEETSGTICVPSVALRSIDSLIEFDKPKCKFKADEIYSSQMLHNTDISDLDGTIREHLSENHCHYCSRSLPVVYYQSQKKVDVLLCTDCFHDGRFVTGHSSIDYIRVDSATDDDLDGNSWSDQETLLLLEAVEVYNDNWNEIAEHVGTKSKAQCILHFLSLPVEDGKLENINVSSLSLSSNVTNQDDNGSCSNGDSAGPVHYSRDSDGRIPFANSGNPVMALVAFLASAVGPRVAATCAHAALAALSGNNSGSTPQIEAPENDKRTNSESMLCRDGGHHGQFENSNKKTEDIGSCAQNEGGSTLISAEKVKDAAKAGLSAAAMKAKLFADHEEREIQRLCANVVNSMLKRLELKLKQFAEIETQLMKECDQVEKVRQRFASERSHVASARLGNGGTTPPMNVAGVGPSMISNNSNSRQQMLSASSSQPSISVYGNSQSVHPHMSFVPPRPSVFGLGQRLPLSVIQQSQSAFSNPMFNGPDNVQTNPNRTNSGLGLSGNGSSERSTL